MTEKRNIMKKLIVLVIILSFCSFTYTDAVKKIGPGTRGASGAIDMLTLVKKLTTELRPDKKTKSLQNFIYNQLSRFDFDKIYQSSYFKPLPDGYRGIKFIGTEKTRYFEIQHTYKDFNKVKLRKFGDYIELFALKKKKSKKTGQKTFSAYSKQKVFSGPYSNRNLLKFGSAVMRVIDPYNLARLPAGKLKHFTNLTGPSAKIANNYSRSFPELSGLLNKLFKLESFATVKTFRKKKYTHVDMVVSLREKNRKKEFPEISKYLKKIKNLFSVAYTFKNANSHAYLRIRTASREKSFFRLEFLTAKGRFIPFKKITEPVFKEQFSPAAVRDYKFTIVSDSFFNVHGLKFSTTGALFAGHYTTNYRKARLVLKLKKYTKTRISGRFYSFIPPWLIDIFIPSNLDSYINDFAKVMENANNGEGSYMDFRWDFKKRNKTIAYLKTSSEFLDNFFVRFSLKINDKTFIPKDGAVSEIEKLIILLTDNTIKDLKKINKRF